MVMIQVSQALIDACAMLALGIGGQPVPCASVLEFGSRLSGNNPHAPGPAGKQRGAEVEGKGAGGTEGARHTIISCPLGRMVLGISCRYNASEQVPMGVIADARELADLIKKIGDLELYRRMVDLQGEVNVLSGRNQELEAELRESKAMLSQRAAMVFREPYYFVEGDLVPYCPKCWEADGKQVHLPSVVPWHDGSGRRCRTCQQIFMETRRVAEASSWYAQILDNET